MPNNPNALKSPAAPSAILLYGIVFLFAIAYYAGVTWQRAYTIILYLAVLAWAAIIVFDRIKQHPPVPNWIDFLFAAFLASVLISVAINWWGGSAKQLQLMPFFFVAPYVLGRVMIPADVSLLRSILIGLGIPLMLLILPEYLHILKYGWPYEDSPYPLLFARGHGVMLSGLLLAASFLSLISTLLSPTDPRSPSLLMSAKGKYFAYALLMAMVLTIGWISSRGPALTALVGLLILLLLSPRSTRRRKLEILLIVALALTITVVHVLQRKHNADFYTRLVQAPVIVEGVIGGTEPTLRPTPGQSILGDEVCSNIADSVSERWIHYQQAVALFLANPLFGAGANHYGFYACQGPGSFPHSTLLQVFAELGTIVGLIYCALLWTTLRTFMRLRNCSGASGSAGLWLLAFSVMNLLVAQLSGDYFVSAALYIVIGIAAGARNQSNRFLRK